MRLKSLALTAALCLGLAAPAQAASGTTYVGDAKLLIDNQEIFGEIRHLVEGAERSVAVDYYVLGGPQAEQLADLLVQRQREGVVVRVMLDPDMGILPALKALTEPVVRKLRLAQVPVRFYPREALARLHGYRYVEDHNKSVVVDGVEAVCTSMNFGAGLLINHEVGVHISGNAAHAMDMDILSAFELSKPMGPEAPRAWPSAAMPTGNGGAHITYVPTGLSGCSARQAVLCALQAARTSVDVMMSQLEDQEAVNALIAAHGRGVAVRVLLDPNEIAHLSPLGWAPNGVFNLQSAVRLAAAGVAVSWYAPPAGQHALHAKSALIDGQTLLVGSTNWNFMSFDMNNETLLRVEGGRAPARFASTFQHDWTSRANGFKHDGSPMLGPRLWAYQGLAWILN
ncbi:MAG: Phospholipase endonuclease protein [Cyanobacteria bacterium RYN_339]|nr:Phospholipase endonuclease protein [Cyanobacteria bacterium RYN_339]